MRRAMIMARFFAALCAVCLTVLLNWQSHAVAVQLFRFGGFKYNPVFEARFYEGKEAEYFTPLLPE